MTRDEALKAAQAQLEVIMALAQAIRESNVMGPGTIPDGHLYAMVMSAMPLSYYNACVEHLVKAGLVERAPGHLLRWVGDKERDTALLRKNEHENARK